MIDIVHTCTGWFKASGWWCLRLDVHQPFSSTSVSILFTSWFFRKPGSLRLYRGPTHQRTHLAKLVPKHSTGAVGNVKCTIRLQMRGTLWQAQWRALSEGCQQSGTGTAMKQGHQASKLDWALSTDFDAYIFNGFLLRIIAPKALTLTLLPFFCST